jgi:hypothetical protein
MVRRRWGEDAKVGVFGPFISSIVPVWQETLSPLFLEIKGKDNVRMLFGVCTTNEHGKIVCWRPFTKKLNPHRSTLGCRFIYIVWRETVIRNKKEVMVSSPCSSPLIIVHECDTCFFSIEPKNLLVIILCGHNQIIVHWLSYSPIQPTTDLGGFMLRRTRILPFLPVQSSFTWL